MNDDQDQFEIWKIDLKNGHGKREKRERKGKVRRRRRRRRE